MVRLPVEIAGLPLTSAGLIAYTARQTAVGRQRLRLLFLLASEAPLRDARSRTSQHMAGTGLGPDLPEKRRETDLSTEQTRPQAPPRLPCALRDPWRPPGARGTACQVVRAALRLRLAQ